MTRQSDFVLTIKNCRAIRHAEIGLSDITVLTGVNASGKSTIARMFCNLVETSVAYDRILATWLWERNLSDWSFYSRMESGMGYIPKMLRKGEISFEIAIEKLQHQVQVLFKQESLDQRSYFNKRSIFALSRKYNVEARADALLKVFHTVITNTIEKYKSHLTSRTPLVFKYLFPSDSIFDAELVKFLETEHELCDFQQGVGKGRFEQIAGLKRAIYIESPFKSIPRKVTPTFLNMPVDPFWRTKKESFLDLIRENNLFEVLAGKIQYDLELSGDSRFVADEESDGQWKYHRVDGEVFDLAECATGIKALSILNILYSNGWLDSETLLIIDEPEAHLHPQWVVEYARILLLLNRKFKVRLLLTSHSPDMVNALSTVGKSLGMDATMRFYLAEKADDSKFQFNFRDLGTRVGDIFKAYNVSFSQIDDYATKGL